MYCERCEDVNIEDHPYNHDNQCLCFDCLSIETESMDLDLDNAVRMYKLRTPNNRDDDDFIKHVFAQISSGYMQIADWWTNSENLLDITYLSGIDGELQDVQLVCGTGGPHTWLDTQGRMIYSRHGSVLAERGLDYRICDEIVSYYSELFNCR